MSKASHSRARARTAPPKGDDKVPSHLTPAPTVAVGPNTTGPTDQIASVHVDEEGNAPVGEASDADADNDREG